MLYKLDEYWQETILDADATMMGRAKEKDSRSFKRIGLDVYIEVEDLLNYIENFTYDMDHLKECLREMEQDREDNYRPITKAEQYE